MDERKAYKETEKMGDTWFLPEKVHRFIVEIQQALTDKKKGGTKLNVNETGMLKTANEILSQIK